MQKKSFQTFQTFQSTLTRFSGMWENRDVSMDHRDMRGEIGKVMVGDEAFHTKYVFPKRTQMRIADLLQYEHVGQNTSWVSHEKTNPF